MSSGLNLDLTDFINPNLSWKSVKKGPRSDTRCSRKVVDRRLKVEKLGDPSVNESLKLGVEVLGEHFAEKLDGVPLKKRRLLLQSKSDPPLTPSVNHEGPLSPQPNTPSPRSDKCTSTNFCSSEELPGVALLAIAACSGSIEDFDDHVESFGVEEFATPEGIDQSTAALKEIVTSSKSEGSSVQESSLAVVQSLHHSDENDTEVTRSVPSKNARLHWDLNTVMDEWEDPNCDTLNNSEEDNSEGIVGGGLQFKNLNVEGIVVGGLQFKNLNVEGCRTRDMYDTGCEPQSKDPIAENFSNKSDKIHLFVTPASPNSLLEGRAGVMGDLRGQVVDRCSLEDATTLDFPMSVEANKLVPICVQKLVSDEVAQGGFPSQKSCKSLHENKLTSADPQTDCFGSEFSHGEQRHLADEDHMKKVQEGYDSPYEDGELREPDVYAWDANGIDDKAIEFVDSKFDLEYEDELDTSDYSVSEKIQADPVDSQAVEKTSLQVEKDVNAVPDNDKAIQSGTDVTKKPNVGVNFEGNDSNSSNENKNGDDEVRTSAGNMLRSERSSRFDGLHSKGTPYIKNRSDYVGETYSRAEREIALEKIVGRDKHSCQGRSRNEVNGRWGNSDGGGVWESRTHNCYPRLRNSVGGSVGKLSGLNSNEPNQSRSYVPREIYRPLNRRQSPTDRNESYGIHRGTLPMRGYSRGRSRGRSGFTPHGFRRDPQEEYYELGSHHLDRKERGFSPSFRRDAHISRPRRRPTSRSRSRSPIAWNMHIEKRRHSPDLRPCDRVLDETFQKPGFSGDFKEGFMSLPRNRRLSPQRNSRCFDDRKCMDRQYRDRRISSPERMFRRNQRFDSDGYPERLKSGDHFRPMTHS